jgi:hypothetical protein
MTGKVLLRQQIMILRMFADEAREETAARHDLEALRADVIEHRCGKLRADATAAKRCRNFGVIYGDDAGRHSIICKGNTAFDVKLVAAGLYIVSDSVHAPNVGIIRCNARPCMDGSNAR